MFSDDRRALIFANGEQVDLPGLRALLQAGDFIVAADNGLRWVQALSLQPDLVIGDLDSIPPVALDALREQGVRIEQHPVHKDETDLELALERVLEDGFGRILVIGALGGRLDMTLANLFLLGLPGLADRDVRLEDGLETVFLVYPGAIGREIAGRAGDRVSLLPWEGPARAVRTEGLYYPLRGEDLFPERTRGISNRMVTERAQVSLESGRLLCIHTRTGGADATLLEEE